MKKFWCKKIIATCFLFIWSLVVSPIKSFAIEYVPLEPKAFDGFTSGAASGQLGNFLASAFQFGLALAAALAVIMIVWGGVEVMLSESVYKKGDGKKKIQDAIWGLILALISWSILWIINPDILNFKL